MNRNELEHIIRAAAAVADVKEILIFGSQAILAQFPELPNNINDFEKNTNIIFKSIEADIIIPNSIEKTEMVEGAIGELSLFHNTFGYYAQGIDITTSTLPENWQQRLVKICNNNTNGIAGLCLEIHDLIISKLVAGRKKDIDFFQAAINLKLLDKQTLLQRLNITPIQNEQKNFIKKLINKGFLIE